MSKQVDTHLFGMPFYFVKGLFFFQAKESRIFTKLYPARIDLQITNNLINSLREESILKFNYL